MATLDLTKKLKAVQSKSGPKKATYPTIDMGIKVDQYEELEVQEKSAEAQKKCIKEDFIQACVKYRQETKYGGDTIELTGTKGNSKKLTDQRFSTVDYSEESEELVQKLVGKKNYKDHFEISREIKLSKLLLADEKKLMEVIDYIEKQFGLDGIIDVKQVIKPKDTWQEARYNQKVDQLQFDELFKPVRAVK